MARLSLVTLLTLALSGVAFAAPPASQEIVAVGDVHTAGSWSWADCGTPDDIVAINSINVSPDPPKLGQKLTVTVDAYASETIENGAWADVTVKVGLFKILIQLFDLCEEAKKANATVQCPIQPGDYTIEQTVDLPKEIAPTKYRIDARGFSVSEEDLFCLQLIVDFTSPFRHLW